MAVKNIKYVQPIPGSSSSTPSIVVGDTISGGQSVLLISDMSSRDLLEGILIELRKLNLRQEEAFEETVNEEDI